MSKRLYALTAMDESIAKPAHSALRWTEQIGKSQCSLRVFVLECLQYYEMLCALTTPINRRKSPFLLVELFDVPFNDP